MKRQTIVTLVVVWSVVLLFSGHFVLGACPSSDLSGDCRVDYEDFALMGGQWLTEYDCNDLTVMASQWQDELSPDPNGTVLVNIDDPNFIEYMSKYETTNAQYCQFLNEALASGDITVGGDNIVYGASGSNSGAGFVGEIYFETYAKDLDSQITYSEGVFSVRSRDGYDMSDHPVVEVSWYGATAFCNYYGFRLPTEWEWQAVAGFDGSYIYGCGTTIDHSKANYDYDNPLGLSSYPYTSPVDHYPSYGYGMNDMAGNVVEWTSSCYSDCSDGSRVVRGGGWTTTDYNCTVSYRGSTHPFSTGLGIGFRVCFLASLPD